MTIRPIPSYPGYAVSPIGEVWSEKSQRYLSLIGGKFGSKRVNLSVDGRRYGSVGVHRLVCEAFHGPAPEGKPWALHRNGDAGDNRPENIYWGTPQENVDDMMHHGTHRSQSKTQCPAKHPYDEDNTYFFPDGSRGCRTCHRNSMREMSKRGLPVGDSRHGTNNGYANYGCRCSSCKEARKEYIDVRRKS